VIISELGKDAFSRRTIERYFYDPDFHFATEPGSFDGGPGWKGFSYTPCTDSGETTCVNSITPAYVEHRARVEARRKAGELERAVHAFTTRWRQTPLPEHLESFDVPPPCSVVGCPTPGVTDETPRTQSALPGKPAPAGGFVLPVAKP